MALFGFRTRDPQRDRETDLDRIARLSILLDDLRAEMEHERSGLRDRYESVTMRAAFSQQALENDRTGPEMSSTIDELTLTMSHYTQRIASLGKQIDFVAGLRQRVDRFIEESQGGSAFAGQSDIPPA